MLPEVLRGSGEGWRRWTDLRGSWAYKCLQGSVPIPISMFWNGALLRPRWSVGAHSPFLALQGKKEAFRPGTWGHDCPSPGPAAICGMSTANTCPKYSRQHAHKYPKSHRRLPASSSLTPPKRETCASFPEGAYACCDFKKQLDLIYYYELATGDRLSRAETPSASSTEKFSKSLGSVAVQKLCI